MTSRFHAVVEQGVLRPTVPVDLPEGSSVEVFIVGAGPSPQGDSPAEILAAIAALPSEPVDPTTSARHDDVLYRREAHP
jgi:predicted DNA-binding antitoxin AbrB/MazE fold protein